jgi:hypothetical protein
VGVQIIVEELQKIRPTGFRFSSTYSFAYGSPTIHVPSDSSERRTCRAAPAGWRTTAGRTPQPPEARP